MHLPTAYEGKCVDLYRQTKNKVKDFFITPIQVKRDSTERFDSIALYLEGHFDKDRGFDIATRQLNTLEEYCVRSFSSHLQYDLTAL